MRSRRHDLPVGVRRAWTTAGAGGGPRFGVLLALALAVVLSTGQDARALAPHLREGFTLGAGFGVSPGRVSVFPGQEGDAVSSDWEWGVTPEIRLGYAVVKNRLAVSVANQQWLYEQGLFAENKLRINAQSWILALNYYPGNPRSMAGGLQLFAGVGLANARLTLLEPLEDDPHGNRFKAVFKEDEGGTTYQVGIGYEFRVLPTVAVGVAVSYIYQDVGGAIFDDASAIPMNLTLNWYY